MSNYEDIQPISGPVAPQRQRAKRHYGVHPYFTRRAWNVVQAYIDRFSKPGDLVLDPFGGSGVTAVEALVMGRRGMQVDTNPLANFIASNVAVAPVSPAAMVDAFRRVRAACYARIAALRTATDEQIADELRSADYPRDVKLPQNADVTFVHELFSPRQLAALAILREAILSHQDETTRGLLMMAFSGTLAKTNRTFISARNRKASRGGASIFSIYRYNVPKEPVELDVWDQFDSRWRSLMAAKRETNRLIGERFCAESFRAVSGSATRLTDYFAKKSVDYIYTDPPYGAHIAYLDLSTMWNAWLGLRVEDRDREDEVIEGGDVGHSADDYSSLLRQSIHQMFEVLKPGRWLSLVFCHRDPTYWSAITRAAEEIGFCYANTVVQPLDVVWSMHRKKNPLKVLAGELVINFLKPARARRRRAAASREPLAEPLLQVVRRVAEETIRPTGSATTEDIYFHLIPVLLEGGLIDEACQEIKDFVPVLSDLGFVFGHDEGTWRLNGEAAAAGSCSPPDLQATRKRAGQPSLF